MLSPPGMRPDSISLKWNLQKLKLREFSLQNLNFGNYYVGLVLEGSCKTIILNNCLLI